MPFSFCIKLCCIEAAGHLVEESFNGTQTSTRTLICDKGGKICTTGKISVNQQQLWFPTEHVGKWPWPIIIMSVSLVTNKNHHTVECFCVIKVSVSRLSKAVRPPDNIFSGFLCINSCLKLKFACLRPAHVLKTFLWRQICWRGRNRTGANSHTGRFCGGGGVFPNRTSCTYTFHSKRSSWFIEVMKATVIMIIS